MKCVPVALLLFWRRICNLKYNIYSLALRSTHHVAWLSLLCWFWSPNLFSPLLPLNWYNPQGIYFSCFMGFHCTQLDYKFHSNHINRDYFHNAQNDLHHAHNYILYQNYQFYSLYADTLQDWCRCFHMENADVDLPFGIFHICVVSIIFNTRNCWIDLNAVGFYTVYQFFWFWSAQINFFFLSTYVGFWLTLSLVADSSKELSLWWWSNPISTSEEVFLCSFTASTSHVLTFSTLVFCFICILTLSVLLHFL